MIRVNFLKDTKPKVVSRPPVRRITAGVVFLLAAVLIVSLIFALLITRCVWGECAREKNMVSGPRPSLGQLHERSGSEGATRGTFTVLCGAPTGRGSLEPVSLGER